MNGARVAAAPSIAKPIAREVGPDRSRTWRRLTFVSAACTTNGATPTVRTGIAPTRMVAMTITAHTGMPMARRTMLRRRWPSR